MVIFGLGRGEWMIAFIGFFIWTAARTELRQAAALSNRSARLRRTESPEDPPGTSSRAQQGNAQIVEIELGEGATGEWDLPHSDHRSRRPE